MDGQQRLLAIKEFFSNLFKLSSLSILAPLNGRTYAQLPSRTKRTLDRASLSAIVLLKESRAALRDAASSRVLELKKFVLERLNTGGKQLNPQEIRNAIYSGQFNDLIISLTRNKVFTDVWAYQFIVRNTAKLIMKARNAKKNLYRTMGDCQIVLRFFALRDDKAVKGSMRSILDHCMESNLTIEESAANRLHGEYIQDWKLLSLFSTGDHFS